MRFALTICALLLGTSLPSAAERQWNTGTWAATADAQFLAIETPTQLLTADGRRLTRRRN